jgi:hypothetical protein
MATAVHTPNVSRVSFENDSDRNPQSQKNGRRRERLKLRLPLQVRPFDARFIDIEDVGEVMDFTRDGLYFISCMPHYLVGMRLIVTFPFGEKASAHHRFLGSVVRLEDRPDGTRGIAVRFLV